MAIKIAIDISQLVYGTGVSVYTENLTRTLVKKYPQIEWVLFGGVFKKRQVLESFINNLQVRGVIKLFPPKVADLIWNKIHMFPIENWVGKVDLIHTSDWAEPPSLIPKITTVHDLVPFKYPETTTTLIKNAHRRKMLWVKKESRKILTVSKSTKNDLIKDLGFEPDKIDVTHEGVEAIYYPHTKKEINRVKSKYKINGDYLFSLSTLEPRKNHEGLIRAFENLRVNYPRLKLVIGGRMGWGNRIQSYEDILILGYVPVDDLPALYSGSLAYVLPSFYEGFGLSQLQAMSCGTPVVTSNVSSMPEVVDDAGILVDPYSITAITKGIITAIEKRDQLRIKGLERVKMFSWEKVAEKTFRSYMNILNL